MPSIPRVSAVRDARPGTNRQLMSFVSDDGKSNSFGDRKVVARFDIVKAG